MRHLFALCVLCASAVNMIAAEVRTRPYRLPSVNLKERLIWNTTAEGDGVALSFGGQDQVAGGEMGLTRVRVEGGEWQAVPHHIGWAEWSLRRAANSQARAVATIRARYLHGASGVTAAGVRTLYAGQLTLEQAADALATAPPPRASTSIVWHGPTKRFILFGGDHLDYLTNDTWAFDPAERRWSRCKARVAPHPRGGAKLAVNADGTIVMSGGYTYSNNTDYMGGPYIDHGDGTWIYNVAADQWSHTTAIIGVEATRRTYRRGPFHPDFFLEGDAPDPTAIDRLLAELPVNVWKKITPPRLPQMNRDWGTAVLDLDRDLILRFAGGHSAHGGTDVLHFHLTTGRWELPFPVELPLGQTYVNTEYPEGTNFNGRPWVTGHTYQSYAYDWVSKKMIFTGRRQHWFVYDPDDADWISTPNEKPKGMTYGDCYYTLTTCATPAGVYCWTKDGLLFLFDGARWNEVKMSGEKLRGAVVDNSTLLHDEKRNRLVFFRKEYGDKKIYDGTMQAVNLTTLEVTGMTPINREAAAAVPYLCQIRYDAGNDLYLVGGTLPPDERGVRRTPAYDPAGNRWVSLKLTGDDPSGAKGRNVSLGLMYDAKRKCFWAVDAKSVVYVVKVEGAEVKVME